jgi:Transposase DNA-binding
MTAATRSFGETHFAGAKLGNKARTRRLVKLADQMTRHPGGTLPQKMRDPAALQAAYRLMQQEKVTHAAVLAPHIAYTRDRLIEHPGPVLVICDSTELDYTHITSLKKLGQIGDGYGRGYICHHALAVDPQTRHALGLTNQILHIRAEPPKGETRAKRRQRKSRESRLWPEGTRELPGDSKLIVVCDRGGDTFEELEHEQCSGRRFVIRSRHNRRILDEHSGSVKKQYLETTLRREPACGTFTLEIAAAEGRAARTAALSVSFRALRLAPPRNKRGDHSDQPLAVWVVRVWEPNPPAGEKGLEWVLLTNEPVVSFDDAWRVIEWYECRWVVEEYHKAQKTGCAIEQLQFTDEARLEPMIAILSVVALTLLNLRDASRAANAKTTPATTVVAQEYVEVLSLWRHKEVRNDWTVHDFFYALARLGGHQNRNRDKRPGWQVLWQGWTALQLLAAGAQAERRRKKVD